MKRVYRYRILPECEISVPGLKEGSYDVAFKSQVIKVGVIRGEPSIWCMIDDEMREVKHKIKFYGTGYPITAEGLNDYLGSFLYAHDTEIYHVFESIKKEEGIK